VDIYDFPDFSGQRKHTFSAAIVGISQEIRGFDAKKQAENTCQYHTSRGYNKDDYSDHRSRKVYGDFLERSIV
jgi:hypothetical protein